MNYKICPDCKHKVIDVHMGIELTDHVTENMLKVQFTKGVKLFVKKKHSCHQYLESEGVKP